MKLKTNLKAGQVLIQQPTQQASGGGGGIQQSQPTAGVVLLV
jgi:hypothetical protein